MLGEIFAIECPVENKIKAISQNYGHIPRPVLVNPKFKSWSRKIKRKGLKPRFIILDSNIEGIDQDLLFSMYTGLFNSWNIELYCAMKKPQLMVDIKRVMLHKQKIKIDITDLGYFEFALIEISNNIERSKVVPLDQVLELILYCILYRTMNNDHLELLQYKKDYLLEHLTSRKTKLINIALNQIDTIQLHYTNNQYVFPSIRNYTTTEILRGINLVFKTFHFKISLDKSAWIDLNGILGYLHDEKEYKNNPYYAEKYDQLLKN